MNNQLLSRVLKYSCITLAALCLFLVSGVAALGIVSGTYRLPEYDPPASGPPSELLDLPREAFIECPPVELRAGGLTLWECPGTEPLDPDSAQGGSTGALLGCLDYCTPIVVVDYAWSRWDATYYVQVRHEDTVGWIGLSMIQFASP